MMEGTNHVRVMPSGTTIVRTGRRKQFWIITGIMLSIIIIAAVAIPTSIILTRKKDTTTISLLPTSPAITNETTISTSTKIETLTNGLLTTLDTSSTERIKWKQNAIIVAGGNRPGDGLNKLSLPCGISIDHNQTIYIADSSNDRVVQWKSGENKGKIVAGRNEQGDGMDQLNQPTDVCVDQQNDSLIICDSWNNRVIRCSIQNPAECQILISSIRCGGVTMDKNGSIYVSDSVKNEVRRWKKGESQGTIVAGGNRPGNGLNQLNSPGFVFVDENESIYVSDRVNNRVIKWLKDARQGIIVAGENWGGNGLHQFFHPVGVIVDRLGQIYVADSGNDRVMRWCEGCEEGEIVAGGNGQGGQSNQLDGPTGLSFDVEGNLYVSDANNHRIQKFAIDSK